MTAIVDVRDVTKVFRTGGRAAAHAAVNAVTLAVARGSCLGIVGESGSGKTTLARMVVGLEAPTSGSIEVAGLRPGGSRTAARRRRWARQVQMVFQDPYTSLDRRQTGRQCLQEVMRLHFRPTRAEAAQRVGRLADQVGLSAGQLDARPAQLSGGQRQRLAIARALAVEPEVLVLDESVSALDVSVQAQVLNCLSDIREQLGITALFVSHDLGVIRQIADQVVVMRGGEVVERGDCAAVLDDPVEDYTRRLKDSVPRPGWRPPASAMLTGGPAPPIGRVR